MFLFISLENRILRKVWLRKEETKISLKHKKIDAFGLKVFAENKTLKEIELPETLKRIDYECFCNCSNLEKVVIHDGLKSIDCSSFSNCTSLKEIELPDSVEHIGDRAFDSCTGLEKIKLSGATKEILSFTFNDCLSLETVIIPEGVKKIQNTAFFGCKNLKYIELPSTLISAFNNFKSCQNLEEIVIKDWRILLNGGENGVNFDIPNSLKYVYINKKSKQMIISNKNENLEGYEKITINNLKDKVDERYEWITYVLYNYLFGDIEKNKIMKNIYDQVTRYNLNQNNYRLIQKDLVNSKNFEQMLKYISKKILDKETRMVMPFLEYELFKFSYALGIFSENEVERQKASEFIKNVFEKKTNPIDN